MVLTAATFDIRLPHCPRGFYLITHNVLSLILESPENGLLVVFIRHTSADTIINESAGPDVCHDFNMFFNRLVPDETSYFIHTEEGPGDMSAHIKALLVGTSVTTPIRNRRLNLGTWQDIYLYEFRDGRDGRKLNIAILKQFSRLPMLSGNGRNERHCSG